LYFYRKNIIMSLITDIKARQIFDSRGNPTVEVDILTEYGILGRAAVPSGASTGANEAIELRDGSDSYMGKSVFRAVQNVNEIISNELLGNEVSDQLGIDRLLIQLDGTDNKSKLGANAILGVSLAVAKAAAKESALPLYAYIGGAGAKTLPVPMMNIVNGGSHSDAPIAFQEFMIVPHGAKSFRKAMQMATEVFHSLKANLKNRNLSTAVGDEGGFAPVFKSTEDAIETILSAIDKAGYTPGKEISLALDVAASEFYIDGIYDYTKFEGSKGAKRTAQEQAEYLLQLVEKYPIISIEDGMDENDWKGWKIQQNLLGDKIQLVGDDIFVTNTKILAKGIEEGIANSILIKLNQIGTLSETLDAINLAHKSGYTAVVSHRSGETEDTTIADLAVAMNTGQIKTGSLSRTDRMAKYNQLLRIEEQLGEVAVYPGINVFKK